MSRRLCAIALIGSAWCAAPCDAGVFYEYTLSGTLFDVNWLGEPFAPFDEIDVGDPWEAVFVVEPVDADIGLLGFYWLDSATVTLPGISLTTPEGYLLVDPVDDEILFHADEMPFGGNTSIRFAGNLTNDDLPDVPTLEALPRIFEFGAGELGGSAVGLDGSVDNISLRIIPAPATVACFVGALLMTNRRRRSRLAGPLPRNLPGGISHDRNVS